MLRRASGYYKQVRYVKNMPKRKGVNHATPNPGIENRLQIFRMETPSLEGMEDDVELEDLESDFSQVGKIHREFEREKTKAARTLSFVITKDKYFKSAKLPNLLTWSEKEQIKYLHQLDPKEWDVESLSKSFPSTPDIIKKILKSKWKPKDGSALERHDKAVERNWILLKEGKFNLEDELRCHFLNFSSRKSINHLSESHDSKRIIVYNRPKKSEFVDLLSKSARKNDENSMEKSIEVDIPELLSRRISPEQKSDSFVLPSEKVGDRKLMSFKEFKEKYVEPEMEGMKKSASLNKSTENYQSAEVVVNEASNENVPVRSKVKAAGVLVKYKKESLEQNLTAKQLVSKAVTKRNN
ncbi:hypothetical protein J437_LFUL015363 [Ladona fulva]|uniref:Neurite outgrowth-associated protein n=1 Tax=Ladona fulva TaxID=123851 RepID=A0A8K0KGG0_LADFU|nr:hypothetical protein J437_LFUL015363 [Ladona fulva]